MSDRGVIYDSRRKVQAIAYDLFGPVAMSRFYYRLLLKKRLHLENPQTFNEKIQWYKLNYCPQNEDVVRCSDKYRIREYLARKNLLDYQVPLLGVWTDARDIPFDDLPDRFALKCNHGCAYNVICSDQRLFDRRKAVKTLNRWMREDFSRFNAEVHYGKIQRAILCEEFLENDGMPPVDYKIHCFNGEPRFLIVCSEREHGRANYSCYDLDWKSLPYSTTEMKEFKRPQTLDEMIEVARIVAADFPFVRVDLYDISGKVMIGELTFVPAGGLDTTLPAAADAEIGDMLDLSQIRPFRPICSSTIYQ